MKPEAQRIWYLVKFSDSYRCRTYFDGHDLDSAKRWIKQIKHTYGVRGKIIKVRDCK